jgi:hypothetical protein
VRGGEGGTVGDMGSERAGPPSPPLTRNPKIVNDRGGDSPACPGRNQDPIVYAASGAAEVGEELFEDGVYGFAERDG